MLKLCKEPKCNRPSSKREMCEKHYRRWWRDNNREHVKAYNKRYHRLNHVPSPVSITKICQVCKSKYTASGRNQKYCSKTCQNNATCRRKLQDPRFKLIFNLRNRLRKALKGNTRDKGFLKLLGCDPDQLKLHLESKFQPGMSWDNYGEWHIDHIKPLANFDLTDKEELKKACNYSNLQPLWAADNFSKGST